MNRRQTAARWATVAASCALLTLSGATTAAAQDAGREGRKSAPLAFALSFVLPGAGQVYNGDDVKGAVMFGGAVVATGALILTSSDVLGLDDDTSGTGTHVVAAAGAALIISSWIDAPLSAKAINRRSEAGGGGLDLGPRLEVAPARPGVDLNLLRIGF